MGMQLMGDGAFTFFRIVIVILTAIVIALVIHSNNLKNRFKSCKSYCDGTCCEYLNDPYIHCTEECKTLMADYNKHKDSFFHIDIEEASTGLMVIAVILGIFTWIMFSILYFMSGGASGFLT